MAVQNMHIHWKLYFPRTVLNAPRTPTLMVVFLFSAVLTVLINPMFCFSFVPKPSTTNFVVIGSHIESMQCYLSQYRVKCRQVVKHND